MRADKSTWGPDVGANPFYPVTTSGINPMMTRLIEEAHLMGLYDAADIGPDSWGCACAGVLPGLPEP
jgi:hypothetical protein